MTKIIKLFTGKPKKRDLILRTLDEMRAEDAFPATVREVEMEVLRRHGVEVSPTYIGQVWFEWRVMNALNAER